jgi:hypothetical protein
MELKYNIVWFEDSKKYVESLKPRIERHLAELGFEPDISDFKDASNFAKVIEENDPDLILVDQNLADGDKGDQLISAIRNNELYTEVVFYAEVETLPGKTPPLEGVFYATRHDLFEKTKKLIDLTIRKNQDISNMRGLFIAEAIDATEQMEEIISRILKLSGEELDFFTNSVIQDEYIDEISKYKIIQHFLDQKIKSITEKMEASKGSEKALLSQLKTDFESVKKQFDRFQDDVIVLRNKLAHAKRATNKKNTLIIMRHGRPGEMQFGEEECKKARESFLKHRRNLQQLDSLLRSGH